jgi:hypothetical protein
MTPEGLPTSGVPTPTRSGPEGLETTGGSEGVTPTGRKVEGQETVQRPGADGVETTYRPSDRPNR